MKNLQKCLLFLASTLAVNSITHADEPYIGIKAGQFDVEIDSDDVQADKPIAYGIYGGYSLNNGLGIELEYVDSRKTDMTYRNVKGDFDTKTYGAFGTYRHQFGETGLYAKGKLGFLETKTEGSAKGNGAEYVVGNSESNFGAGIGIGVSLSTHFSVEAEYALNGTDADLMTVGAHFKF